MGWSPPSGVSCKPSQTDCSVGGDRATPSGDLVSYTRLPGRQSHLKKGQNKKRATLTQPTTRKTKKQKKEAISPRSRKDVGFGFESARRFYASRYSETNKKRKKKKKWLETETGLAVHFSGTSKNHTHSISNACIFPFFLFFLAVREQLSVSVVPRVITYLCQKKKKEIFRLSFSFFFFFCRIPRNYRDMTSEELGRYSSDVVS